MPRYYSLRPFHSELRHSILVDDWERLQKIDEMFNVVSGVEFVDQPIALRVRSTIESEFLIPEGFRNYSNDEIANIAHEACPSEYYCMGGRIEIFSQRLFSILKDHTDDFLTIPIILLNEYTSNIWPDFLAVRFTKIMKREHVSDEPIFVDERSFATYFDEELHSKIMSLGLTDITSDWIYTQKFK